MHCVFSDSANPVILRESCWKEATFQSLAAVSLLTLLFVCVHMWNSASYLENLVLFLNLDNDHVFRHFLIFRKHLLILSFLFSGMPKCFIIDFSWVNGGERKISWS